MKSREPVFWHGSLESIFNKRLLEVGKLLPLGSIGKTRVLEGETICKGFTDQVGLSHAAAAIDRHKF